MLDIIRVNDNVNDKYVAMTRTRWLTNDICLTRRVRNYRESSEEAWCVSCKCAGQAVMCEVAGEDHVSF